MHLPDISLWCQISSYSSLRLPILTTRSTVPPFWTRRRGTRLPPTFLPRELQHWKLHPSRPAQIPTSYPSLHRSLQGLTGSSLRCALLLGLNPRPLAEAQRAEQFQEAERYTLQSTDTNSLRRDCELEGMFNHSLAKLGPVSAWAAKP